MVAGKGLVLLAATLVGIGSGAPVQAEHLGYTFGNRAAPGWQTYRPGRHYRAGRIYEYRAYNRPARSYIDRAPWSTQAPDRYGIDDSQGREGRRDVQARLNRLGFSAGRPDGVYGGQTRSAMAEFQASLGHRPTGRLTGDQVAILYERTGSSVTVSRTPPPAAPPPGRPESVPETDLTKTDKPPAQAAKDPLASVAPNTQTAAIGAVATPQTPKIKESRQPNPSNIFDARTVTAQTNAASSKPTIDDGFVQTLPPGALPVPLPRAALSEAGPFGSQQWQPKIFGFTAGDSHAVVRKNLDQNGYANCTEDRATMVCSSSSQSMSDRISVAFSTEETGKPAFLVRRSLTFKTPVSRAYLERQMAARYPQLLADADGILSTSETCKDAVGLKPGLSDADALHTLFDKQKTDAAVDDATLDLLEACPDYYAVAFDGAEEVSNVEIVIFNAATMRTKHLADLRQRQSERSKTGQGGVEGTLKF